MKNKITILVRCGIAAVAVGSLSLVGSAAAQKSQYKPLTGSDYGKPPAKAQASPSASAAKATKAGSKLSAKDKAFMMGAAKGGMMEVEWGKWAAQNGQNPDVKKFGNRMVTDHSKANNELMALAKEEGVQLPAHKSHGKWKSDKDYIDMMVKDHEKDAAEFRAEASGGSDPDLKKFAEKTSKVVEKHLAMAKEIQGKLK